MTSSLGTVSLGTAVVTGSSSGIGKVYAQRLASRGYDLILVARDRSRLDALAADLSRDTGRKVEVLAADLGDPAQAAAVAARIEADAAVTLLVNNAGMGTERQIVGADADKIDAMVQLNVAALARLTVVGVNGFARRGKGTLINIASVVAIVPENFLGAYAATKAYVLALTQSLATELKDGPVRVQAVLPGLTSTEFFDRAGMDKAALPADRVMSAEDLVDAALAGLDRGEVITIPPLPDAGLWDAAVAARAGMAADLSHQKPAARYRIDVAA